VRGESRRAVPRLHFLRVKGLRDHLVIRDRHLFCTVLALLVSGLVIVALWIAYVVQSWD
jgi:hypothetical protein